MPAPARVFKMVLSGIASLSSALFELHCKL